MLIQNTNPMAVAPEQALVRQGFAREDLFMAVHEQFMTETAQMADIVLPATMFMEHDDLYYGGGHQHISVGAKLIEPPGECRSNHELLQGLGRRLNAVHPGFEMSPRELIDATLKKSGHGDIGTLEADLWRDIQPDFRTSHYLDGFAHADKKFHFKADWAHPPWGIAGDGSLGEDAVAARPLDHHRGGRRGAPVPAGDQPVAQLSQFQFQRDAVVAGARGRADRHDASGRRRHAWDRRRRCRHPGQYAGRDNADRQIVRWSASRRADRGIDSPERRPHRGPGDQYAHRRRGGRTGRGRRIP
jgi:Anaerobic dehydrogenases, typically selenocysteine-containing